MIPNSFIENILSTGCCKRCHAKLELIGVRGIGIRGPHPHEPVTGQPVIYVVTECVRCGADNSIAGPVEVNEAISAARWIVLTLDSSSPHRRPDDIESRPICRPSLCRRRPKRPITDREVEVFLRVLGRTSFRRNTVSFRKFMKRLKATPAEHGLTDEKEGKCDEPNQE